MIKGMIDRHLGALKTFFSLLQFSKETLKRLGAYMMVAGIINSVLLGVVNKAASNKNNTSVNFQFLLIFGIALAIYYISKIYIFKRSTELVEEAVAAIRTRILGKLNKTDLASLEKIGKADVFTRLSQDTATLSQTGALVIVALQSVVMLVIMLFYIAILSFWAVLIVLAAFSFSIFYFLNLNKKFDLELREASHSETRFFNYMNHLIEGFKELQMNREKSREFLEDVTSEVQNGKEVKIRSGHHMSVGMMMTDMTLYILLGLLLFVLPQFTTLKSDKLLPITTSILYIIGPAAAVAGAIPSFAKALVAGQQVIRLETELDNLNREQEKQVYELLPEFEEISFQQLSYNYRDPENQASFTLGPVDFSLKKGELVGIMGGNGSGKSTLLKLITKLYLHDGGEFLYNGQSVEYYDPADYRNLFSVIYSDFHLFEKLYGVNLMDVKKVNDYLELMGLSHKTKFDGKSFTHTNLSTGQRKRLALICALLEDRPILILDEVTSDQDPGFRKYFYEEVLPSLKAKGKTILMVSHDDHYTTGYDRLLHMDYGKFV